MASHDQPLLATRILLGCAAVLVWVSARPAAAVPTVTGIDPDFTSFQSPTSPVTVFGSNINPLGTHRCRWEHQVNGGVDLSSTQGPVTATEMPCVVPDVSQIGAGPIDVSIADNGSVFSTTSATILLECNADAHGDICQTCSCILKGYCNDGWQGDGTCLSCPDGTFGSDCSGFCLGCSFQACDHRTGASRRGDGRGGANELRRAGPGGEGEDSIRARRWRIGRISHGSRSHASAKPVCRWGRRRAARGARGETARTAGPDRRALAPAAASGLGRPAPQGLRDRRARVPPLWRPHEAPCGDPSARCDERDPRVPRPPGARPTRRGRAPGRGSARFLGDGFRGRGFLSARGRFRSRLSTRPRWARAPSERRSEARRPSVQADPDA